MFQKSGTLPTWCAGEGARRRLIMGVAVQRRVSRGEWMDGRGEIEGWRQVITRRVKDVFLVLCDLLIQHCDPREICIDEMRVKKLTKTVRLGWLLDGILNMKKLTRCPRSRNGKIRWIDHVVVKSWLVCKVSCCSEGAGLCFVQIRGAAEQLCRVMSARQFNARTSLVEDVKIPS